MQTVRKQQVDLFLGVFKSGYKADACSYNVIQEDIDSFLKRGTVQHGEWFLEGKRLPLASGEHRQPLPPVLSERDVLPPDFPEYNHREDINDGCACQFAGKTNYHQVGEWYAKTSSSQSSSSVVQNASQLVDPTSVESSDGIMRTMNRLTTMHGKGACDGVSNVVSHAVREAQKAGHLLDPGTRELILYLAQHKQTPAVAKLRKDGWWTVGRIFWGFYDTKLFTQSRVPPAKGFDGSATKHEIIGCSRDKDKAMRDAPLMVRNLVCACSSCREADYDHCKLQSEVGRITRAYCPLDKAAPTRITRSAALEGWTESLEVGQIVAVRVAVDERGANLGHQRYWLARLRSKPYELSERQLHAGNQFEPGWIVCKAEWFDLVQTSHRGFRLLPDEMLLSTNDMIRLRGIDFEKVDGRGRSAVYKISEKLHNELEDAV